MQPWVPCAIWARPSYTHPWTRSAPLPSRTSRQVCIPFDLVYPTTDSGNMKIGRENLASEADRVDLDLLILDSFWFCSLSCVYLTASWVVPLSSLSVGTLYVRYDYRNGIFDSSFLSQFFISSSLLTCMLCACLSMTSGLGCVGLNNQMCVLDLPFSYRFRSRPAVCISST